MNELVWSVNGMILTVEHEGTWTACTTLISSTKNPIGNETKSHDWGQTNCYAFLENVQI